MYLWWSFFTWSFSKKRKKVMLNAKWRLETNLKRNFGYNKPVIESGRFASIFRRPLIFRSVSRDMHARCFKSLAINIGMASARVTILIYQACCATDLFPYISNSDTVYTYPNSILPNWSETMVDRTRIDPCESYVTISK